jgi:hypothetical protein
LARVKGVGEGEGGRQATLPPKSIEGADSIKGTGEWVGNSGRRAAFTFGSGRRICLSRL